MKILKVLLVAVLMFGVQIPSFAGGNVAKAQFTTRVADREPVNNVTRVSTEFNKVFFFTDIRDCKGCRIEHQWWFRGNKVSTVDGRAKYDRYRWWSSKTLTDNMLGDWTVKLTIDGDVVKSKTFTYYKPTFQQQAQEPVSRRLEAEELEGCEIELRYFNEKLKEEPDNTYYNFMMKKLKKRCLGE